MKAFISYSHRDEHALAQLHKHLAMLRDEGAIETWFDRDILAGSDIDQEITAQLDACELFLPLVSPDFLDSDYCREKELRRAVERHDVGDVLVVPIIVEPCDWRNSPIGKLKAIPKDGKPVSEWTNENTAYLDIVTELRRLITAQRGKRKSRSETTHSEEQPSSRYRIKRDYDQIDRDDFRDRSFDAIKDYFEKATREIDAVEGLRARFRDLGPTSFSCTVLNTAMNRGQAHITVHSGAGGRSFGDITYSFNENASPGTANGWFSVDSDEYDLFLRLHGFTHGSDDQRVSVESGAEILWEEFVSHAGIESA